MFVIFFYPLWYIFFVVKGESCVQLTRGNKYCGHDTIEMFWVKGTKHGRAVTSIKRRLHVLTLLNQQMLNNNVRMCSRGFIVHHAWDYVRKHDHGVLKIKKKEN